MTNPSMMNTSVMLTTATTMMTGMVVCLSFMGVVVGVVLLTVIDTVVVFPVKVAHNVACHKMNRM